MRRPGLVLGAGVLGSTAVWAVVLGWAKCAGLLTVCALLSLLFAV